MIYAVVINDIVMRDRALIVAMTNDVDDGDRLLTYYYYC